MSSGSSPAFQRRSRDTPSSNLGVRLAVTRFPVVPSGWERHCGFGGCIPLTLGLLGSAF
eukprot:gene20888-biopygen19147